MRWEPGGVFKTMCQIDITYYPFDEQVRWGHCAGNGWALREDKGEIVRRATERWAGERRVRMNGRSGTGWVQLSGALSLAL